MKEYYPLNQIISLVKSTTARHYRKQACFFQSLGDTDKALDYHTTMSKLYEEIVIIQPYNTLYKRSLAGSYGFLANHYRVKKEFQKALEVSEKSLHILEEVRSKVPGNIDIDIEYSFACWFMSKSTNDSEKRKWLEKAILIIEPMINKKISNPHLKYAWDAFNNDLKSLK